jgi:aldehyde:ferredoxin oxidoreductase
MYGLTGKILRVNLTTKEVSTLKTEDYKGWIGGHGLATALWFDLVKDKTISAFDPKNVLVLAPGLFSGTLIPGACRTEIVGIQAQSWPYEWFTRSNAGGRFANMLKYAGFDAIVLEGAADKPTWINIVEGEVELKDATGLWGLDTYETQKVIFSEVTGGKGLGEWIETKGGWWTTQRPAILCIGPAGENKSRIGTIQTDAGNAMGQGGFGGIWGAKNLKAISVIGTGSVDVADPKAVMEARLWAQKYATDVDNPKIIPWLGFITSHFGGYLNPYWTEYEAQRRPAGCYGCHMNCRPKTSTGLGNESICADALVYSAWDLAKHEKYTDITGKGANLSQQLGINVFELRSIEDYLKLLYDEGVLGPGKQINTTLRVDRIGEVDFLEDLYRRIAYRQEIGDDFAEGLPRAAERWGRIDQDEPSGRLHDQFWGYKEHYDTRCEVYWGYACIVSARDVNCHDFNVPLYRIASQDIPFGRAPLLTAKEVADIFAALPPYYDPEMANYANDNLYSVSIARATAWLLHYSRFWKQACGLCDNAFADFANPNGPNNRGLTPEGEVKFYKAVTGENLSFEESMELGRKMFNLNKAIWTLQGRHRDMEKFPEYVYTVDAQGRVAKIGEPAVYYMPVKENDKWDYKNIVPRHLDKDKVEEWKTLFYELEGWDTKTGWQTRATLEGLGLKNVADELEAAGKLPA